MAPHFYPIRVREIKKETENAISLFFEIPAELRDIFQYKHGQYITLRLTIDGKTFNRAYSLGSSPTVDEHPFVTIKKTEYGFVSGYLTDHIAVGDTMYALPPMGNFTIDLEAKASRLFVMFGGGSGITPLFSIIKAILSHEPHSRIILFYANRDDRNIIFENELHAMAAESNGIFRIVHALSEPSKRLTARAGAMTSEHARSILRDTINNEMRSAQYFICGPSIMMQFIENALDAEGIPESQIHREVFVAQHDAPEQEATITPSQRNINVRLYGKEYNITVATGATILEAAIDQNLDPPYACQVAACCTCRAKLISGKVQMDNREALTDEELDEGYILTCQSHPLTDDVAVDYDQ